MENQPQTVNDESNFLLALQLASGSNLFIVMRVAIELDVFEIIAKAGSNKQLSSRDIVSQLPTRNPNAENMLDRILRLLASYSLLTSSVVTRGNGFVERVYGLSPIGKYFVKNHDGVSLSPLLLLVQDKVFVDSWYQLKDAILEGGIPFTMTHGTGPFEYTATDPKFNQVFNNAMHDHTFIFAKKMIETYKGFEELGEILDVGGGLGITVSIITSKYPTIKGVNFDLPHVVQHAPLYPGVEHIGGDMFSSVPKAENIFMKTILHDWNDESCVKVLKNCYKALPENGKLIIVDAILPVEVENTPTAKALYHTDVTMMTQHIGGKERTEDEINALAKSAGFTTMKNKCRVYAHWVMEFKKI